MANSATPRTKRASASFSFVPRTLRITNSPIEPRNTMPASTPSMRTLRRMSPFRMWLNSWPMTACSSSRVRRSSVPRVTATTAPDTLQPAANALMPLSSCITYTSGTRVPEAIAISSTTLRSRRSSGSAVFGATGRAPTICATAAPPLPSRKTLNSETMKIRPAVASAPVTYTPVVAGASLVHNQTTPRTKSTATMIAATASRNRTTMARLLRRASCWCSKNVFTPRGPSDPARREAVAPGSRASPPPCARVPLP